MLSELEHQILAAGRVPEVLRRLAVLKLPQLGIGAGSVVQPYWNSLWGKSPDYGMDDIDILYYDHRDLSEAKETALAKEMQPLLGDINLRIEAVNVARVHLWYPKEYGIYIPQFKDVKASVKQFALTIQCVLATLSADGSPNIFAPHGLEDVAQGILRKNPYSSTGDAEARSKIESYRKRWRNLRKADSVLSESLGQTIHIASQFSATPGGRYSKHGQYSAESFLKLLLLPAYQVAKRQGHLLTIDFDGGYGYNVGFLEEAFGGLVRETRDTSILSRMHFISEEQDDLVDTVTKFIIEALELL